MVSSSEFGKLSCKLRDFPQGEYCVYGCMYIGDTIVEVY